jgi:hypothetical protein
MREARSAARTSLRPRRRDARRTLGRTSSRTQIPLAARGRNRSRGEMIARPTAVTQRWTPGAGATGPLPIAPRPARHDRFCAWPRRRPSRSSSRRPLADLAEALVRLSRLPSVLRGRDRLGRPHQLGPAASRGFQRRMTPHKLRRTFGFDPRGDRQGPDLRDAAARAHRRACRPITPPQWRPSRGSPSTTASASRPGRGPAPRRAAQGHARA